MNCILIETSAYLLPDSEYVICCVGMSADGK